MDVQDSEHGFTVTMFRVLNMHESEHAGKKKKFKKMVTCHKKTCSSSSSARCEKTVVRIGSTRMGGAERGAFSFRCRGLVSTVDSRVVRLPKSPSLSSREL
jgi:hypothetical protein